LVIYFVRKHAIGYLKGRGPRFVTVCDRGEVKICQKLLGGDWTIRHEQLVAKYYINAIGNL